MAKKLHKCTIFIMCICLLLSMNFLNVSAIDFESSKTEKADVEAVPLKEVPELREANSETYLLSDGTLECRVFPEDKYYLNNKGEYIEIDNSIANTKYVFADRLYEYANISGSNKIYFSDTADPSVLVITPKDERMSFSPVCSKSVKAVLNKEYSKISFDGFVFDNKNSIRFEELFQSTDLIYSVVNSGLKEYIIIKDEKAPNEFYFNYNAENMTVKSNDNGTVSFTNSVGEEVIVLNPLFAVDSAGIFTEDLSYKITENQDGTVTIGIEISDEYINDKDRVFPILIDPTTTVSGSSITYDACVCSMYPNTNYQYNSFLRTGRDDEYYIRRSYIKFAIPNSISSSTISSAYLDVFKMSGATPNVTVYRVAGNWASSSITWNNKPSYSSSYGTLSHHSGGWYRADVTTLVRNWTNGTYTNYGFLLKDATETGTSQWTTYYSSDSSSYVPELIIRYSKNISLSVPMYKQQAGDTCGAASLRMVLAYYGNTMTEQQVKDLAYRATNVSESYKYPSKHSTILNYALTSVSHSYHSFTSSSLSSTLYTSRMFNNMYYSHPVIVIVNWQSDRTYFNYATEGHFIVARGINSSDYITVNDPYTESTVTLPASTLRTYNIGRTQGELTSVSW